MRTDPSRGELLLARQRWALVNAREWQQVRRATIEEKFDQLEGLMQSLDDFGWRAALDDDARIRDRWNELRRKLRVHGTAGR
jgi:hypothetical protein